MSNVNQIFRYMLAAVLTVVVMQYGDAIASYAFSFFAPPVEPDYEIGANCSGFLYDPFGVIMIGSIILLPLAPLAGFVVWRYKEVQLQHNDTPHRIPTTIWRKS